MTLKEFEQVLCTWIRRIVFVLAMPIVILCCIEVFGEEDVEKTALFIILDIFLLLLTLWNLVFYFISRCEIRALLVLGLIFQTGIAIALIFLGADVHAMSSFLSIVAFLMYLGEAALKSIGDSIISKLLKFVGALGFFGAIAFAIYEVFAPK